MALCLKSLWEVCWFVNAESRKGQTYTHPLQHAHTQCTQHWIPEKEAGDVAQWLKCILLLWRNPKFSSHHPRWATHYLLQLYLKGIHCSLLDFEGTYMDVIKGLKINSRKISVTKHGRSTLGYSTTVHGTPH